ncbi:MAG: hypothetical protein L3K26_18720, partial [Candidatus Hydrogenedentes bacterium]|nr:hypothetical protein [Candidatus Hydrogenedentota bacterium]
FDDGDQKRLTAASVTLQGSGFAPMTENEAGVYAFPAVLPGAYDAICVNNGYVDVTVDVRVGAGEVKSIVVPMGVQVGGEGEGEGEGEGDKEPGMTCAPTSPGGMGLLGDLLVVAVVLLLLFAGHRRTVRG